jgi:hypothetical protein
LWCAYLLAAPSNADKTITVTFPNAVGTNLVDLFCIEVPIAGGTASFDQFVGQNIGTPPPITAPNITSLAAGEFLYAAIDASFTVTGAGSPWTDGGSNANHNRDQYDASSTSGTVSVNFQGTGANSASSDVAAVAFAFTPSAPLPLSLNLAEIPPGAQQSQNSVSY